MTISAKTIKEQIFKQLDNLKDLQSFDSSYFPAIEKTVETIATYKRKGLLSENDIKEINSYYGKAFLENTLHEISCAGAFLYDCS